MPDPQFPVYHTEIDNVSSGSRKTDGNVGVKRTFATTRNEDNKGSRHRSTWRTEENYEMKSNQVLNILHLVLSKEGLEHAALLNGMMGTTHFLS